jgi:hypothetical protein
MPAHRAVVAGAYQVLVRLAAVARLTQLGPSPYPCQSCFMFIRVFVGLELRPSVFEAPGAFLARSLASGVATLAR